MNRKEAFLWVLDNPKAKLYIIKNENGIVNPDKIICELEKGVLVRRGILGIGMPMALYVENDKTEFEVVRELKKMCFGEAVWHFYDKNICISNEVVSCETGICYWSTEERDLKLHELKGLWTVKGIYE